MEQEKRTLNSKALGSVTNFVYCGIFTVLIIVGAYIKVPISVVPFTLQFFFTSMAGLLLGSKLGAISVMIYALLGLLGLPVFSTGGGIAYIIVPSFGYIIGFILGTYITGKIVERKGNYSIITCVIANMVGLVVVYAVGMVYYFIISNFVLGIPIGVWHLFLYCFLLAVPGDFCLCILSASLAKRLVPFVKLYD